MNPIWKSLVAGALAVACGAWAVGSLIGGAGSPPPDTGDPVVVVAPTSPSTGAAHSRPAGNLEDDVGRHHSGDPKSGGADDDERDGSRSAAPGSVGEASAANGQTGATGNRDDGAGKVEIPRRVEDPDDQNEDDQGEDEQGGDDDDGGVDD